MRAWKASDRRGGSTTQEVRWILAVTFTIALLSAGVHNPASKGSGRFLSLRPANTRIVYHRDNKHRQPLTEAQASWYGPADSGGDLACTGQPLTSSVMELANKTLPCGTRVRVCLRRAGPCRTVRVEDRGPYVAGREYDLSEGLARAIGFLSEGVGPVFVRVE
jgi:rare lipoprotein A (peptidoglycan hydrolase)